MLAVQNKVEKKKRKEIGETNLCYSGHTENIQYCKKFSEKGFCVIFNELFFFPLFK